MGISQQDSGDDYPDISFQVYDFRGQLNLSLTERVFYADSSLYIIVFNLDADDISSLREKLVDIKVKLIFRTVKYYIADLLP